RPHRAVAIAGLARDAVVSEPGLLLLRDEPGVLEQAEMAGDARLREPEDAGELRHVQALARERPKQPQPGLVAEQPIQRGRLPHIYESTFIDSKMQARFQRSSIDFGQSSRSSRE